MSLANSLIFLSSVTRTYVHVQWDVREALYSISLAYTRKCAANIVEKYKCSLVAG